MGHRVWADALLANDDRGLKKAGLTAKFTYRKFNKCTYPPHYAEYPRHHVPLYEDNNSSSTCTDKTGSDKAQTMLSELKSEKKPRVVVLGKPRFVGDDYLEEFRKDFDYDFLDVSNHQQALEELPSMIEKSGPVDAFIVRMGRGPYHPFDEELFKPLTPQCRIIASASAGYDDFDVEWMTRHNIWLCNSIDAVAEATADMSFFLTLAVIRDTYRAERCARDGTWKEPVVPSRDPSGMTLGIIGMGTIGKHLAKRAAVFNMRIKYYNRRQLSAQDEARFSATYCPSLHELLSQSDVVSVNCPLSRDTTNLISTQEFAAMRDGAFIVNTARGPVIDEPALIEALESGKITRAGLDVFWDEPNINDYFRKSDKVIVQPHVAGLTDLAFQKGEREAFENIKALFKTGKPISPVNEIKGRRRAASSTGAANAHIDLDKFYLDTEITMEHAVVSYIRLESHLGILSCKGDGMPKWTPRNPGKVVALGASGPVPVKTPEVFPDEVER
ncbi:hypothetical protein FZEAL_80 [Fusarium zealandicum]|uniref:2-hydroxyacid dehydrogenase n=1 Tax=Fusarium zealandicum TaxID=1053134 RepID=A0A8H4UW59_9HYPO|nr:hypothetical protein FZEAL_80 [Fusarium zealandicum]